MTTVSQIITDAYQYNNIVALSAIPSAAEEAKGLRYLNRIFSSVFGTEVGEYLTPWNVGKTGISKPSELVNENYLTYPYLIPHNARLVLNLSSSVTAYLSDIPQDGQRFAIQDIANNLDTFPLTVSGNGRKINNLSSLVVGANNENSEWFYRADLGNWVKFSELSLIDEFPFPKEFEEFFIAMLGIRLGASEDVDLNNQLAIVLKETSRKLKARYNQIKPMRPEAGLVRTTSNKLYARSFSNG